MENKNGGRFAHLYPILKRYPGHFWIGTVATVFANGLMLINPYLVKLAFDAVEKKQPAAIIFHYASYMIGLAVVAGVFRFIMRRSVIWASREVEYDLRAMLFTKWQSLDPTYYHHVRTGDLMAHASNDIEAVRMMIGPGVMHITNSIVSTIIALGFMLTLSPKMTLYTILPMTFLSLIVNQLGGLVHKRFLAIQSHFSTLTSKVQENLAGMRVVRAYRRENSEIERFGKASRKYAGLNLDMMRVAGLFMPLLYAIGGGVTLVVLFIGGKEITAGKITLGTLVAFFGYLGWLIWPMMALGWVISLYQRGTASLDRINKILNSKPNITDPGVTASSPTEVKGKIEFRNLTFTYPSGNGKSAAPTLHDINLVIEPGSRVGIIGPTGSGKTTLVALIPRQFPTGPGQLLIDGVDINLWPLATLRRAIGFVPQETFLFSDTLAANVTFGVEDKEGMSVEEAARLAALHEEVESFPNRYETILGERGITLSGGQKQRAALARAIVAEPAIVILDDATSSVDTETEHRIFAHLNQVLPGRTSIIISHRVASLKDCDQIIYLENGRIVERGTHQSLIALGGAYTSLYKRQLMEEQLEKM